MNVLARMRLGEGFSSGERALADVILASPDAFLSNGSKQLAARAHVSKSTVYRLCEKLGCSGLSELRVRVASELEAYRSESPAVDANFPVRAGQSSAEVISGIEPGEQVVISDMQDYAKQPELKIKPSKKK